MSKIGLVGGSSQQRSLPFNAERSVNFFPVLDQEGKEVAALYGTPGLLFFTIAGLGPIRGCFYATNGRGFVVSGSQFIEINSSGAATIYGSLGTSSGPVTIDENGVQLAVCDGTSLYIFTYATNTFALVTDADLPSPGTVTFIDGYFVINKNNSGQFNISALYDGTSWAALDFATAESSPDNLNRVFNAVGQLWLFGDRTTEIWTDTGAAAFPFERNSGGKMEVGIASPYTAVAVDNSVYWVGRDSKGTGIVYKAQGFTPQRISTNAIELLLQQFTDLSTLFAFTYQEEGHVFYIITGGPLTTTLVYDISTNVWHERAYLNDAGLFEQHLASCGMFAFGQQIVGDRTNGNLYTMSLANYSDNGRPLARERTYTHLSQENQRVRYNRLTIGVEVGVGNAVDPGSDPQILMSYSRDGAKTWSQPESKSMGKIGEYLKQVVFRRLGIAREMTFRIRISDPVKVAITGSYLE